jgi:putative SOS response-associated peptidase YedK
MCGRIVRKIPPLKIAVDVGMDEGLVFDRPPRYNIPPGAPILAVRRAETRLEFADLHWGLVPSWANEKNAFELINARAETIAEKPGFRDALRKRRCAIVTAKANEFMAPFQSEGMDASPVSHSAVS